MQTHRGLIPAVIMKGMDAMAKRQSTLRRFLKRAAIGCAALVVLVGAGVVWLGYKLVTPPGPTVLRIR